VDDLVQRLKAHGLTQVLHNVPAGDWAGGERGIAILPGRADEFKAGVEKAIAYATALDCKQVHCIAGIAPAGSQRPVLEETFIANLRFAAGRLKQAGIKLLIEAINPIDIPGFFLNTTAQALDIIARTGSDNLFVQYDIYHMQITEGELACTMERNISMIPHIQLDDNPGRHEPGTGESNYPFLFAHLDRIGYSGWVGAEDRPRTTTEAGLGWFEAARTVQG
jgi:hydroxypyruvate isomerase